LPFDLHFFFITVELAVQDVDLEEKVDVIISEWMGYMLLYEVSISVIFPCSAF
jgi:protein arginine N-methyltransferase 6